MRKDWFLSAGAVVLAFLAGQHHSIHMLALAVGLGGAGSSLMTTIPLARRIMLAISLAMAVFLAWRLRDPARPRAIRIADGVSIAGTLGLAGWSIATFGL